MIIMRDGQRLSVTTPTHTCQRRVIICRFLLPKAPKSQRKKRQCRLQKNQVEKKKINNLRPTDVNVIVRGQSIYQTFAISHFFFPLCAEKFRRHNRISSLNFMLKPIFRFCCCSGGALFFFFFGQNSHTFVNSCAIYADKIPKNPKFTRNNFHSSSRCHLLLNTFLVSLMMISHVLPK